ncbi:hypothetical protein FQR65_LT15675 [Abscondita terminalis]|nr:hypothetical protein FQR65_LT15675 [Abscondita terminalis]
MFKIAYLVALTALTFSAGDALNCYVCSGSDSSDCYRGEQESLVLYDCDILPGNQTAAMCYSLLVKLGQALLAQRSCGYSQEGESPCEQFISNGFGEVIRCSDCKDNLCNWEPIRKL